MLDKRKSIDLLIEEFWRKGYMTIRRKFGTYLPEPNSIGGFEVDVIARQKKNYAIGIFLSTEELNDPDIETRIKFLATRQTAWSSSRVILFIGVESENIHIIRELIKKLSPDVNSNIRVIPVSERKSLYKRTGGAAATLFSRAS